LQSQPPTAITTPSEKRRRNAFDLAIEKLQR